jgi:membrane protease YdiL (CAAX protease family)
VGSRFQYFAITLSSLLYALFHYLIFRLVLYPGYAELGILLLAGFGALMAVLYRRTGSILTTAFAHGILTDLACVVLLFDYARKFGGL